MDENWLVYVNGEMVPMKEAKISVFDRGFQYGDGVFEGLRSYGGKIFKLKEHTERLFRSAKAINIQMPIKSDEFNEAVKRVIRENKFQDAHIKPQVTRGIAWKLGLDPRNTTTANIVIPARPIGKSMFDTDKGFKLAIVSVRKIPSMCFDPRVKSLNYLSNILARMQALSAGADEAILLDIFGYVSEGASDNIFLVKGEELYTPLVQDALEGITRATIIELAKKNNIRVNETKLTTYDIYTADEVFITGSGAGIVAVTEVDKRIISGGKIGKITKIICDEYDKEAQKGESAYN